MDVEWSSLVQIFLRQAEANRHLSEWVFPCERMGTTTLGWVSNSTKEFVNNIYLVPNARLNRKARLSSDPTTHGLL